MAEWTSGLLLALGALNLGLLVLLWRSRPNTEHSAEQAQQAQQASAQSSKQATIDTFYRAHSACMEARGYTVK